MQKIIGLRKMARTSGRSMCGTWPVQNPIGPSFAMPDTTTVTNVNSAKAAGRRQGPGRRAGPGEHAEQVAGQDEEKQRQQKGHEAIGIVAADGRPGHLIANEHDHRLQRVGPGPLGHAVALQLPGQTDEDHHQQRPPPPPRSP